LLRYNRSLVQRMEILSMLMFKRIA